MKWFSIFKRSAAAKPRSQRSRSQRVRLTVEPLEQRLLLHGYTGLDFDLSLVDGHDTLARSAALSTDLTSTSLAVLQPLASSDPVVPLYSSNPGAPTTLYLDFDGHQETFAVWDWELTYNTPVFDLDSNLTTFSTAELDAIKEIWQRVAEDYAPFNVNVTTDLGQYQALGGLRVAIGGHWDDWYHVEASGVTLGNFDNTVWVFSAYVVRRDWIADTASHEAGHHYGLEHQSAFDADGNLLAEYRPADGDRASIMGDSFFGYPPRSLWSIGPSHDDGNQGDHQHHIEIQDDLALLNNRLGYRADDHGNSFAAASALLRSGNELSGAGIITTTADQDVFSFTTSGGSVFLRVNVLSAGSTYEGGANLDGKIELWRYDDGIAPVFVAAHNSSYVLGAYFLGDLPMGKYYLFVQSHGLYGDVGQYTVTGTAPAGPVIYVDGGSGRLRIDGADDSAVGETATVAMDNKATSDETDDRVVTTVTYGSQTIIRDFAAWKYMHSGWVRNITEIDYFAHAGDDKFFNNTLINSVAFGGAGNDDLNGGSGNDYLYDNDGLAAYPDIDILRGGGGNDQLYAFGGNDHLYGGDGDDDLYGGDGDDVLLGDAGSDRLHGNAGSDWLYGGIGNDTLYGWSGTDHLFGEEDNDVLYAHGWENADVADNTTYQYQDLYGGTGNDVLYGSTSVDYLYGEAGDDQLYGGGANDQLYGGDNNDRLYGGTGDDTLSGGNNNDLLYGEWGNDNLAGDDGNDTLYGGNMFEYLWGSPVDYGSDILSGGNGDDVLWGGYGNDSLYGASGYDQLWGGYGDDYLDGGNDGVADYLAGGPGADTFKAEWYKVYFSGRLSLRNRDYPQDFTSGDVIV